MFEDCAVEDCCAVGRCGELVRGQRRGEGGDFGGGEDVVQVDFGEDGVVRGLRGAVVAVEAGEGAGAEGACWGEDRAGYGC